MSYDGHTLSLASLHYLLIFRPWYCIIYIKQPDIIFCLKQLVIFSIESVIFCQWRPCRDPFACNGSNAFSKTRTPNPTRSCSSIMNPQHRVHSEFHRSVWIQFLWSVFYFVLCYSVTNESLIFQKILNVSRTFSFLSVICFEQPLRSQKPVTLSSPACLFFLC